MRAAVHDQRAVQRRIGQDQDGVGEYRLVGHAASCSGVRREQAVSDGVTHVGVVADRDDRGAARLRLVDHGDDRGAVLGIERGGGFVQQQHRMAADEAAREVDPLLLAAGEGRRRQGMQAARNVQPQQQRRWRCGAPRRCGDAAADQHLGDDIERGHARHHAQELADIAERLVADREDGARIGAGEIDHRAVMADQDAAAVGAIVAVQAAHQRRLADARWPGQHDAFAARAARDRRRDSTGMRTPPCRCRVKPLASASVRSITIGRSMALMPAAPS